MSPRLWVSEFALLGRAFVPHSRGSGCGTVLTLLAMPEDRRDLSLSENAREAAIIAITTGSPTRKILGPATVAIALRAVLPDATTLSGAERQLLEEWLDRLAASGQE